MEDEESLKNCLIKIKDFVSKGKDCRPEARELCFSTITKYPKAYTARLILAKLYYLDGYNEFAIRELVRLKSLCDLSSLGRLIDAFGEAAKPYIQENKQSGSDVQAKSIQPNDSEGDDVVAEIDFEADVLAALEELEEEKG